jgi:hypothetical protein
MTYAGFAFCSPFCGIFFNILVLDKPLIATILSIRFLFSAILCIVGIKCMMRAAWIARRIDERINQRD